MDARRNSVIDHKKNRRNEMAEEDKEALKQCEFPFLADMSESIKALEVLHSEFLTSRTAFQGILFP
jgi:hypothetical protein